MPNRLLELLAAEVSRDELDRTARELAAPDEDTALARRVWATLDRCRRREGELAALVDAARELMGLPDLDPLLAAVVRRGRALLGTDTAYLALVDEDGGDARIRMTDGSVSARLHGLRLPRATGLGGLVLQSGAPHSTASYLRDERFRHTSEIDAAALDEGLLAVLGVPLAVGGRVLGVLFAANRRRRPFAREEVELLGSLGALAAVAIGNALRLAQDSSSAAQDRAHTELAQRRAAAAQRAADLQERMTALVLAGAEVGELATALALALPAAVVVLDADGRELAAVPVSEPVPDAAALRAVTDLAVVPSPAGPCTVAAMRAGDDPLGFVALPGRELTDDGDRLLLRRAAQATALVLVLRSARAEAENRLRGELLADLLGAPQLDPDRQRERALRQRLDLDAEHVVVAAEALARPRLAAAAAVLAAERHGLAGEYRGAVVLLLPGRAAADAVALVHARLTAAVRATVTVGAAGPARGPVALAGAYREARRCLDALHALGRAGAAACPEDLGFAGLLLADAHGGAVAQFVQDTIGPVLEYDSRRGTELVLTLRCYFDSDRSPARCAVPLHVHANTVIQRLDRVRQLLGEDWTEPRKALQIQLALHLHQLRG